MILIIDLNTDPLHSLEFARPIEKMMEGLGFPCKTLNISETIGLEKYHKLIIPGTPYGDISYLQKDLSFVKGFKGDILGICAGAQVIAKLWGAEVSACKEIGVTRLMGQKDILSSVSEVYNLHSYAFSCPEGFDVLARSESCIQGIKHRERRIYGLIFHPEVMNRKLIEDFASTP